MTSDEQQNIQNNAPNQGAQGIFNAPVSFHYAAPAPETERERRNRTVMLQKVHDFWVKGVLENSLHKAALIDLGMAYQPDAVAYPWEMVVERPDATPQPLPQGTPIASVFDELRGELLILGSPGSGKTTMLLELARTLVERAQQEETHPIPVVFNLSSWAEQRPPLADWLVEELNARYDVPRKVGQAWIDHDQVLPLLDGLDEVRQDARDACVEAINAYRQDHGMVGMVVCSRVADYAALTAKLKLRGAIMVQPLTDEQIDSYLAQAGDQLVAVQTLLHEDAEMRVFANTPLMLSIMSLAYQGMSSDALPEHVSLDARRRHLFDTYVERMLKRRGGSKHYTPEQTRHWLSWLAGRMADHGQTVFYLDKLQPEESLNPADQLAFNRIAGLVRGILIGAAVGSIVSVLLMVISLFWEAFWRNVGFAGAFAIIPGSMLVFGGFYGLIGFRAAAHRIKPERIDLVEDIYWTQDTMRRALKYGMGVGIIAIGASLFFYGWMGIIVGATTGVALWALVLSKDIKTREAEVRQRATQGIWQSAKNASKLSVIAALSVGASIGFNLNVAQGPIAASVIGTSVGIGVGLFAALFFGAETYLKHFGLRYLLYRRKCMPWDYIRFLDHAAERILLRKVGGGYIFVHRMLLEYFASLEEEQPRKNNTPGVP